jgi:hypothetical protein
MKSFLILVALMGSIAFSAAPLSACSVCRCGESMMLCTADTSDQNAHLLNGLPDKGKFRLQLATAVSSKTSDIAGGLAAEELGSEHQREYRPSVRATYGIWNNLSISAELPFSYKRNTEVSPGETKLTTSSGISDAEIGLAWSVPFSHTTDATWLVGLSAIGKLPTGSSDLKDGDERADEHIQPGTGSYDFQVGGAISALSTGMTIHGSLYYRYNGKNDYQYQYGRAVLYNLGVQHRISGFLFGTLQLNGRHAARDRENGDLVEHTGGTVIYAAPGLRYGLTQRVSLTANLQIPVYQKLYGVQSEKVVLNSGFSFEL